MKLPFDLIVLDLEANALDIPEVRITEIGAVRLNRSLEIIDEFTHLVNSGPQTVKAVEITKITDEMLEGQPPFEIVCRRFEQWVAKLHDCKDVLLAAWGAYYDIPVLRSEYRRIGRQFPFRGQALDIKAIAWWKMWGNGKSVDTLTVAKACEYFSVKFEGQEHRALVDARAEAMILQKVAK
jgi:DNA polymerase III epsilon subunit-like protein